jgi:hypothetical protein
MKRNKAFSYGIVFFFIWLLVDFYGRLNNFYYLYSYFDIITHALFGLSLGFILYYEKVKKPYLITLIISFIWELLEKIGDKIITQPSYMLDFFFWDGVTDIFIHLIMVWFVYNKSKTFLKL